MASIHPEILVRSFHPGDGPAVAALWTAAAPGDPITYERFRDLILLDRNFDADGLRIAEIDGVLVGAAYAVRRRIAVDADDLQPETGWLLCILADPTHSRQGIGDAVLTSALEWLRSNGCTQVYFSSYTPNYFLPGLDATRYPAGAALLAKHGFTLDEQAVAMDRTLNDYSMPPDVQSHIDDLVRQGYRFGTPTGDELVSLVDISGSAFNSDWARAIRETVTAGLPLDRIVVAHAPDGAMLGWAMHGTYESIPERFGPFGVLPTSRGTGLGKVLLHLTLQRMRAIGAHSAWFLWTELDSAAGHLYRNTGFTVTRTFSIYRCALPPSSDVQ